MRILGAVSLWAWLLVGPGLFGLLLPQRAEASCIDYSTFAHWTGQVQTQGLAISAAVTGNYVFVLNFGLGLQVIDVSNPAVPSIVGHVDISDESYQVVAAGSYACVANMASGLKVVDISDPISATVIGSVDTPKSLPCKPIL